MVHCSTTKCKTLYWLSPQYWERAKLKQNQKHRRTKYRRKLSATIQCPHNDTNSCRIRYMKTELYEEARMRKSYFDATLDSKGIGRGGLGRASAILVFCNTAVSMITQVNHGLCFCML